MVTHLGEVVIHLGKVVVRIRKGIVKHTTCRTYFGDQRRDGKNKEKEKESNLNRARDIKCFKCLGVGHIASQCPNKRVMILKENGEVESDSEGEIEDDMPPLEDVSDGEYSEVGQALVVRRALNIQVKEEVDEQ